MHTAASYKQLATANHMHMHMHTCAIATGTTRVLFVKPSSASTLCPMWLSANACLLDAEFDDVLAADLVRQLQQHRPKVVGTMMPVSTPP